ncbi:hypothetical protein GNY06_05070 [Elizabethkingia argentiflava]|uniref:Uncharacterized protein n=1 Tax=Elizabethkingia argenteiflava TaxID=2681556 RepID=A0A845PR68_9FLAO|nr:hypothetical protein [Elizabethkingia argenteiflava]NAW50779.1 hypothetical protein [Elizabethkingia argenteiflava]
MIGFTLLRRGTEIDPQTFGKSNLDTLIMEGKYIGMLAPYSMENNNQDADYATSVQKERAQKIGGVKGWRFIFDQTNCFQNEVSKLNNSKEWGIVPILEDGSAVFWVKKNGLISGFDVNLFLGVYDLPLTADITGSVLEVDVTPSAMAAWQGSADVFTPTEFGFNEIQPIAGLNIQLPVLIASATTTEVKITALCSDSSVGGLTDPANWVIEKNGSRLPVKNIGYNPNNATYIFTHDPLKGGENVVFATSKNGFNVYVKDGNYYAGRSVSKIVTA